MSVIDIVMIAVFAGLAVLGVLIGFGKSLKRFTGGIVGIIISIFVCAAIGGMILSIGPVTEMVANLNGMLAEKAEVLGRIQAGVIIYYIVLFLVVQAIRILIVKIICKLFEADNTPMKVINRILGLIFVPAVSFLFLLLVLSVFKLFADTSAIQSLLEKLDGTLLLKLYEINPIALHV